MNVFTKEKLNLGIKRLIELREKKKKEIRKEGKIII